MSRPEAEDGGTYYHGGSDPGSDAQDFEPWRPGDPSTTGDAPAGYSGHDPRAETGGWTAVGGTRRSEPDSQKNKAPDQERRGRWWTEDVPHHYKSGDAVRNRGAVGGDILSRVPDHTRGRILSTREGLLGGRFATVEFENGYTVEVRAEKLERRGWLD